MRRTFAALMILLGLAFVGPVNAQDSQGAAAGSEEQARSTLDKRTASSSVGDDLALNELVRVEQEIARINEELAHINETAITGSNLDGIESSLAQMKAKERTVCSAPASERQAFHASLQAIVTRLQNLTRELTSLYAWESNDYSDLAALCGDGLATALGAIESGVQELRGNINRLETQRQSLHAELQALQARRQTVLEEVARGAASNQVAKLVPYLVGIIFIVGVGVLGGVKLFSEEIQHQLISTGQIVQFVTILILLSVILALGLSEKLTSETLGTLLGGLAGYVLSQGVGRQERQRVMEAIKSVAGPADQRT